MAKDGLWCCLINNGQHARTILRRWPGIKKMFSLISLDYLFFFFFFFFCEGQRPKAQAISLTGSINTSKSAKATGIPPFARILSTWNPGYLEPKEFKPSHFQTHNIIDNQDNSNKNIIRVQKRLLKSLYFDKANWNSLW